MRLPPVAAAIVCALTSPAPGVVLLDEQFSGTSLDLTKWEVPIPYLGRTQVRAIPPVVANGICRLDLDTHNPTALVPGDSFWGSEIRSKAFFPRGNGLIVEARTRFVGPIPGGIIGSVFTYQFDSGPPLQHDEIDFELLSNDVVAGTDRVLTNIFEDDEFSSGGDAVFANVPGLDLTQFNVWRIEWLPDRIKWFVNGSLVREDFSPVPDEDQRVHLNFWVTNEFFVDAYDAALQPVANAAENTRYHYEVDYVRVESVDGSGPGPGATLVNGGFESGDFFGWQSNGNTFFSGSPQPRTGTGALKLYQLFTGATNTSIAWQPVAVEAGKEYSFCGWGRNGAANGTDLLQPGNSTLLKIVWRNASGSGIGNVETPGPDRILPSTPPQTWKFLKVSGTAPAGAVSADLFVIHLYGGSGFENGATWIDDLHFCEAVNSDFAIVSVARGGTANTITWKSHPCEQYTLERSTDAVNWTPLQPSIPGAADPAVTTSAVDPSGPGTKVFYRVGKLP